MARYGGGGHRGLRLTGKILLGLVTMLLVAGGAFGGGVWLYLDRTVDVIQKPKSESQEALVNASDEEIEKVFDIAKPGEPAVALLIGEDIRQGPERDAGRSDTIMLIRADPQRDTITLLSFPRDLEVDHPGCDRSGGAFHDKINVAFALCGELGVANTVKALTNVPINYVIAVNFHGFKEIVNKVGGVYVDVDRRYYNPTGGDYARINLKPGYQKLTGGAALDYARFRHTDSDFARVARQQQFVKALKQSIESNFSVTKLPGIVNEIAKSVFLSKGNKKIKPTEVLGYARFLYELPAGHLFQVRIDGVEGYSEVTASTQSIKDAVRAFLYPDLSAAKRAKDATVSQQAAASTLAPADTIIEVLNGNGVTGDASLAAELLHDLGYSYSRTGDADRQDYFDTVVQYNPAIEGSPAAAQAVAKLFDGSAEEAPPDADLGENALRVIIGRTFHGNLGEAEHQEELDDQQANVTRDFDDVVVPLRDAQRKVSFPVLVPTFRDLGSALDSEAPPRVYRIEGTDGSFHDAVRVTYRSGLGYWGVQETSWTEAPILSGYNETRRVGARTLWLYFNGAKLHMVAFVEGEAAYWVTNTVMDSLPNRTLIAIAKGLQPLSKLKAA